MATYKVYVVGQAPGKSRFICEETKPVQVGNITCSIELLSTDGSSQMSAMRDLYIGSAHAFLILYNCLASSTFADLPDLIEMILRIKGTDTVPIALVAVNSEAEGIIITKEQGEKLASSLKNCLLEQVPGELASIEEILKNITERILASERSMAEREKTCIIS